MWKRDGTYFKTSTAAPLQLELPILCAHGIFLKFLWYIPKILSEKHFYERSSFSKLSVTSPTSQFILHPFRCFTYVTAHSPSLPLFYLRHSSFSNPSFASPASQALLLRHLASRTYSLIRPIFLSSVWADFHCKITFCLAVATFVLNF